MEQKVTLISPNSREVCSPAHYLAELSVTRKNKGHVLPFKFWNLSEYKKEYKLAIMSAHSILKIFPIEVLITSLNSKEGSWIYSLRCNALVDIANRELKRIQVQDKILTQKPQVEYSENNTAEIPKTQPKQNSLNKLRGLDG